MKTESPRSNTHLSCYHCGDVCANFAIKKNEKIFCCEGCKTVFEILSQNNLCNYYELENSPGIKIKQGLTNRFDYLKQPDVVEKLIDYKDDKIIKVQFYLPQIHCSACLWLLENLYQLNSNIESSRVNFLKKEIYLTFNHTAYSLKEVVELLTNLGYEPKITLEQLDGECKKPISKRLIYQVGLAGFAFGNSMLMSLPEYFGFDDQSFILFSSWFSWVNLGLALPVTFYSGQDYFLSAWKSLAQKRLNIDVPIALGVLVLFLRSVYEVLSNTGTGYFDSLCGLLFFLLLGRIFQEKIYHQLSFERDYRSYFPISVTKLIKGKQENIAIDKVKTADRILIRNGELIPVDAYLIKGKANIDNSFATGESEPIQKKIGEKIYAGGRQIGEAIQLEVIRPLNQSKLTRLWSEYAERETNTSTFSDLTDKVSQWFTPVILLVALISGTYYLQFGIGQAIEVMSAVLIVACPCALALAAPFTFGNAVRWLGKQNCYLRSASVVEEMAKINHVVFDKTGTLTYGSRQKVSLSGSNLTKKHCHAIWNLANQSNHPLSRLIKENLPDSPLLLINKYKEHSGKGVEASIEGSHYRLGSPNWLSSDLIDENATLVVVEINGTVTNRFRIENTYRKGLEKLLADLSKRFRLSLISGDNENEKQTLKKLFPKSSVLLFNQQAQQKQHIIKTLRKQREKVMMIGDGLNDAGALREANIGVAVAENVTAFSPACDIILGANRFSAINQFLQFAKSCKYIVFVSFIISFLYNLVGITFAVRGILSPVVAAILMPISSITVVGFVSLAVNIRTKFFRTTP